MEQLLTALIDQSADIAYPERQGRQHCLPVLLKTRLLPSISQYLATGDRSIKGWYRTQLSTAVPFSGSERLFTNINCYQDLVALG